MPRLAIIVILFAASAFGEACVTYGKPTTLTGTLLLKDEAGYNQYAALRLAQAICTVADPKDVADPADPYYRMRTGIREVQVGVYGSDPPSAVLRDRQSRLIGYRVVIKGDLFPKTTGYDRTNVALRIQALDPADPSGQQALLTPRVKIQVKDVEVYDVTINAGKRLVIEARESGATARLIPADQYVTHWMTGGEVVYIDCRDGYKRSLSSTSEKDGGICFDGQLCGLSAFPEKPVIIKFRCTKEH